MKPKNKSIEDRIYRNKRESNYARSVYEDLFGARLVKPDYYQTLLAIEALALGQNNHATHTAQDRLDEIVAICYTVNRYHNED